MSMINRCAVNGRRTTTGTPAAGEATGVCSLSGIEKGAHMKSMYLKSAIAAVLLGAATMAIGAPPEGKGPPPGKGGDEAGNNLSVPAILVGGALGNVIGCGSETFDGAVAPSGVPESGYELDGDYFVQGVHTWQAACKATEAADVYGAWGDNLTGDAKLKVGSPIRVEIVLYEGDDTLDLPVVAYQDGYEVVKLEPDKLDRESAYGTAAFSDGSDGWYAVPTLMTPVVYDAGAHLTIFQSETDPLVDEDLTPEINATGKIVYGYNLRVPNAGAWVIRYTMPNLNFVGCDMQGLSCSGTEASIEINVIGGGGGGGGKPNK